MPNAASKIDFGCMDLDLERVLLTLPAKKQKVVYLFYVQGHTMDEIGCLMGCTKQNVMRLIRSSCESLREKL